MSNLPIQDGKFTDVFPTEPKIRDMPQMSLDLSPQFSQRLMNHAKTLSATHNPREKYMLDFIKLHFPQISIDHSELSIEQIYNAATSGRIMKPKVQAPKKEQVFQEIEYYVKLNEAHQAGKKLPKEQLMDLFKMELQQVPKCLGKKILEDFREGIEFREAMR